MKAFLSHSSKDAGFVQAVCELLRPGTYELDAQTFDKGLLNSDAIVKALKRSDLFCLFLSRNSLQSQFVEFETLVGMELLASGKIAQFLTVCLDDWSFERASANLKMFNVVRKNLDVESTARLIQGHLVSAAKANTAQKHPFIGRDEELLELEKQITDHTRPISRAIYISGNAGSGRRTLASKFFEDQFPHVSKVFPSIPIEEFSGLEELHRKVLIGLRPSMKAADLRSRTQGFSVASVEAKRATIAQLLNSLLAANEAAYLVDMGGVLTDSGNIVSELDEVISLLEGRHNQPVIFIATRMIQMKYRRAARDVSYVALRSLKREEARRLISRLIKDQGLSINDSELAQLTQLSDNHPYNIYNMIDRIKESSVAVLLASPSEFIDWKHRQSSEYLNKIDLSDNECSILALLRIIPELDFESIIHTTGIEGSAAGDALLRLASIHVVEARHDLFAIAPALRSAAERDSRIRLRADVHQNAIDNIAKNLSVRIDEGTAPITLVDSAVLAALESGGPVSSFVAAFLLPSHYVWMAKRHYDRRNWQDAISASQEALSGAARLSSNGLVAACRFMCLAAARLGEAELFAQGIKRLEGIANDDWARSNIAFLKGFNFRLQGNLPEAEKFFRRAYELSPGNLSAARELAAICLSRNNLDEAETFAREAYGHAGANPYVLDILASVLIRKYGRSGKYSSELEEVFDALERVSEEGGRSFFATRRAEFEHLWGDNREALRLIEAAVKTTPTIFEPRRIHAEVLLKEGNKVKALEAISVMREMVTSRDPNERRANYRLYLQTYAHYLEEVGRYDEAKEIYDEDSLFTVQERDAAVRQIEIVQGYKAKR